MLMCGAPHLQGGERRILADLDAPLFHHFKAGRK
jgi:hypothetical protein